MKTFFILGTMAVVFLGWAFVVVAIIVATVQGVAI